MKRMTALLKYGSLPTASGLMAIGFAFPAFASATTAVGPDDWSAVLSAMTSQISVSTIVVVIASCVGAGIGLVFMWWGVRKLARTLMAAFRKGKLSV